MTVAQTKGSRKQLKVGSQYHRLSSESRLRAEFYVREPGPYCHESENASRMIISPTASMGQLCGLISLLLMLALFLRLVYVIRSTHQRRPYSPSSGRFRTRCQLTVLLGSGGHTGEMVRLLSDLPFDRYTPRTYIISSADSLSRYKAIELERAKPTGHYTFLEIPRARRVNQSFLTSIFTTINSLLVCVWFIAIKPISIPFPVTPRGGHDGQAGSSAILLNGPGSSVPIALSAFLPRLITGKPKPRLIYVESLARVKRLSLTGILLLPFVDCFVVQWKVLQAEIHQSKLYQVLYYLKLVPAITFNGWMV